MMAKSMVKFLFGTRVFGIFYSTLILLAFLGCKSEKIDEKIDSVDQFEDLKQLESSGQISKDDHEILVSFLGYHSPSGVLWDSTMTYRQALAKAHRDIEAISNGLEFFLTSLEVIDTSSQDRVVIRFHGKIANYLQNDIQRLQIGMNIVDVRHGEIQGKSNSEIETLLPAGDTTEIPPFTLISEGLLEQPIYRRELIQISPESLVISLDIFELSLESGELIADFGSGNNVKHVPQKYIGPVFEELVENQKTYLDIWIAQNLELLKLIGDPQNENLRLGIKGFHLPPEFTQIDETAFRRAHNIGKYILENRELVQTAKVHLSETFITDIDSIVEKKSMDSEVDVGADFKSIVIGQIRHATPRPSNL